MVLKAFRFFFNVSVSAVLFGFQSSAHAKPQHQCGREVVSGLEYKWCIDSDDTSKNPDVLYYFHGAYRSEQSWRDEAENRAIQKEWARLGVAAPAVISVSFGGIWLMSAIPHGERRSIFDVFTNEIMPALEAKIGGVRGRRMIKAESMGGFNAVQLLLKTGDSLFARGALACPAITSVGPYSSPFEVGAFIQRNQPYIKPELIAAIWAWTRMEFTTEDAWVRHDPLRLVNRLGPTSPKLYISCGKRDEFGFFEGVNAFADRAKALGAQVLWQPLAGGHCAANPTTIAKFLAP